MKEYLGDGVYVDVSYGAIRLTVEEGNVPQEIILEDSVYRALLSFVERLKTAIKND